jgi:hypothetical protein
MNRWQALMDSWLWQSKYDATTVSVLPHFPVRPTVWSVYGDTPVHCHWLGSATFNILLYLTELDITTEEEGKINVLSLGTKEMLLKLRIYVLFSYMAACSLIGRYQRFGGICCSQLQGRRVRLVSKSGVDNGERWLGLGLWKAPIMICINWKLIISWNRISRCPAIGWVI